MSQTNEQPQELSRTEILAERLVEWVDEQFGDDRIQCDEQAVSFYNDAATAMEKIAAELREHAAGLK